VRREQPGFTDRCVGVEPVRRGGIEFRRRRIVVIVGSGFLDVVDVIIIVNVVDIFDVVIQLVVEHFVVEFVVVGRRRIEFVVGWRRRQLVVELQPFEQFQWIGIVAGRWRGRRRSAARTAGLVR
jgi:hypothetical protein